MPPLLNCTVGSDPDCPAGAPKSQPSICPHPCLLGVRPSSRCGMREVDRFEVEKTELPCLQRGAVPGTWTCSDSSPTPCLSQTAPPTLRSIGAVLLPAGAPPTTVTLPVGNAFCRQAASVRPARTGIRTDVASHHGLGRRHCESPNWLRGPLTHSASTLAIRARVPARRKARPPCYCRPLGLRKGRRGGR